MNKFAAYTIAFLAGFASLELEILGTRLIGPVFGDTTYVWVALISVTLIYLMVGYTIGGILADKGHVTQRLLALLLFVIGIYIGLITLFSRVLLQNLYTLGLISGPLVVSLLLFAVPLVLIGIIVPILVKICASSLAIIGRSAAHVYTASALGSIVGALATGLFLLPNFGVKVSTVVSGIIVIAASVAFFVLHERPRLRTALGVLVVGGIAVAGVFMAHNVRAENPELVEEIRGTISPVFITDEGSGITMVRGLFEIAHISNTTRGQTYDDLYRFIPLVNPNVKKVLVLGFGSGITAGELIENYPNIEFEFVEIEPKLVDAATHYFEWDGKAKVTIDDGRHYLASRGVYDAIIVDFAVTHDTSYFSTQEFFEEANTHLSNNGVLTILAPGSYAGEFYPMLNTLVVTGLSSGFEDYLLLSISPGASPESFEIRPLLFSKKNIDRKKLIEDVNANFKDGAFDYNAILYKSDKFVIDKTAKTSTDNNPVYAGQFITYLDQHRRRFLDEHVDWYLP